MKKQKNIYKLELIEYHNNEHQYPEFEIFRSTIDWFSSLAKAEQVMNKYEKEYDKSNNRLLFGFTVEVYEIKEKSQPEIKKFLGRYGYIPDDITLLVDENAYAKFTAHRFLEMGELVEVLRENTVTLEIISQVPDQKQIDKRGILTCLSPCCEKITDDDFVSKDKNSTIIGVWLECGSPCYKTTMCNGKISRTDRANMFPPRFPVSKELKKKYEAVYANPESWQ